MRKTIIMIASVLAAAGVLYTALLLTTLVDVFSSDPITSTALIQSSCADYTEFVLSRTEAGMSVESIETVWNKHVAPQIEENYKWNTAEACGTVKDVAAYAAK